MYQKPKLDLKYKAENWRDFPQDDRLRCQYCGGIYWRLWEDVAQCLGCRSFTGIELFGPIPSLRGVGWIDYALTPIPNSNVQRDDRIRDPISGKSEWIIFHDHLKARSKGQELVISPTIKGTWFMAKAQKINQKVMTNKEAIDVIKKSPALKSKKGEIAIGIIGIIALSVYLIGWVVGRYDLNDSDQSRIDVAINKMIQGDLSCKESTITLTSSLTTDTQLQSLASNEPQTKGS